VKETRQAAPRPKVLSWRAVPGTVVYNVIFVGGGTRIDVWSADNRVELDSTAKAARAIEYTWFAYPGFRANGAVRYGDLVAHGTTRVPRAAIPRTRPPAGGQLR
jgi:hypothetical protein